MSQAETSSEGSERPTKQAILRSFFGRCPACGQGKLLTGYLKVVDHCPHCNEALYHQRADDGPAYLTIFLVSHLGAPLLMIVYLAWRPSAISMTISFGLGAIIMSLLLLPRIKGAFVGFQWARRMHGFEKEPDATLS